jgi:hypothetical protein
MPKKTFTPEQIVGKLRQIEVLVSQGKKRCRKRARKPESSIRRSTASGESMVDCRSSKPRR